MKYLKKVDLSLFKKDKDKDKDIECLNKLSNDIFYEKKNGILKKNYINRQLFDWETYILYIFINNDINLKLNFIPEIVNIDENIIEYDIKDCISLRELIIKNQINYDCILNELLIFLKNLQQNKIVIGNINIDNIFTKICDGRIIFYVIDLSKTNFINGNYEIDADSLSIRLSLNTIFKNKQNLNLKENHIIQILDLYN